MIISKENLFEFLDSYLTEPIEIDVSIEHSEMEVLPNPVTNQISTISALNTEIFHPDKIKISISANLGEVIINEKWKLFFLMG